MATMSRSKFFSWGSKNNRQQSVEEPYHRIGGLLPIHSSPGTESQFLQTVLLDDAKDTTWRRNPKNLSIVPPSYIFGQDPQSALHNVKSAPNLLAAFADTHFPSVDENTCIESSVAPLSKYSLPPSPALPAELPGDFPVDEQSHTSTPPPDVLSISSPTSAVLSVRSMFSLSSGNAKSSGPTRVPQHRKSANDLQKRSKSRPSLIASPSSTDSRITTCSAVSGDIASSANSTKAYIGPDTIVEGKQWKSSGSGANSLTASKQTSATRSQIDELKSTITAQDQTISTLQSQFANLRVSQEKHVSSLVNAHSLEISALKDYAKSLESQQKGLHHASSNHALFMLDTTDNPMSPKRDSPFSSVGNTPAGSIRSFKPSLEAPRSPLRSRTTPEMENLKRKLSLAKRPETGNGDAVRELSVYKQTNEALQKQIESLMAKLNQSEEDNRKQKRTLEEIQKNSLEWEKKSGKTEQLEKMMTALQNTIDHLEYRLEVANIDKVDAEEGLLNIRSHKTPFDLATPPVQVLDNHQSMRTSMSTVFANDSPISQTEADPTTLTAFVSHIERLQEQIRQKDMIITELESEKDRLKQKYDRLENKHRELDLQSNLQGQLLTKTKQHEIHIEELRTAIIKREAMIGEKSKALQQTERQLEHHKLLLKAEIRRHASYSLLADMKGNPLPELTSLASKEDIHQWIERLQKQLNKDKAERLGQTPHDESAIEALRRENDFYVREIIYYKLDCRGYKSDIKKLKKIAAQMGGYESRPEEGVSPDPSDTSATSKFLGIPNLGASTSPFSVPTGPISVAIPLKQRMTPPPTEYTPDPSPLDKVKRTVKRVPVPLQFNMPLTPRTPPLNFSNLANEVDDIDPGNSPRSVAKLSPERRKPTPPSPDQERFGELATSFPLSTPAVPQIKYRPRSLSDSVIEFTFHSSSSGFSSKPEIGIIPIATRERSGSVPEPPKGKVTPERPPRPKLGLFDSYISDIAPTGLQAPPRMKVMEEAMRNLPDQGKTMRKPNKRKPLTSSDLTSISPDTTGCAELSSSSTDESAIPAPLQVRPRQGSINPGIASPSRKPSTASSSSIPFVIAMGSPHNPVLTASTVTVPLNSCSITGKRNVISPSLRTGIGNTMASTTPITSPTSPIGVSKQSYFNTSLPSTSKSTSALPSRSASLSSTFTSSFAAPTAASRSRTIGHARNLSASSIRARIGSIKGRSKSRKDTIGLPTPLASPFEVDRSNHSTPRRDIGKVS